MTVTSDSCLGGGGSGDWPPGFRFHPTDEELVLYYLKRKICKRRLKLNIISELDVYKWDPEELPGQSILKTGDRQWFFFSPRDRKYPNAARSNRATRLGYWKATGKDRNIMCNSRTVGLKKTLVFYRGRAPSGERTDWVMHEYTLDEEELKRCPNVKEYFALYKVYKKSGPGPKNGEQYGAPFREEDWADDDYAEVNGHITHAIPVNQQIEVTPVGNIKIIGEAVPPLSDLEEIMKQITDEPLCDQPLLNDYTYVLPQVTGDEETQSTLVDPSTRETGFPEPIKLPLPIDQWSNQQANFDFDRSAISTLPSHDVPEVAFAPDSDPGLQTCEEDFLEMDDLLGPEPTCFNFEGRIHNSQFDDLNGLCEFDLFQDAEMFLRDMGPVVQDTVSNSYLSPLGNCSVNHVDYQLQHHSIANQGDDNLQTHLVADHVDYQLQEQFFGADPMSNNQLCVNVPRRDVMNSADSNQTFTQPTSGAVCETTNHPTEANENQTSNESNGTSGWFSSTLWSLVDSIPTTPASASESPLVNKALVRMSSFSRVRMNAKKINADANIGAANVRRGGGNKGVIFLSVFGALCAILWLFVGTVRVLGRSISW